MELIDPNFCFCLSSLSFIHIVFLCIIGEYIDNFTDVTVLFLSFFLVSIFLYNSWFVWFVFLFRCGGGGVGSGVLLIQIRKLLTQFIKNFFLFALVTTKNCNVIWVVFHIPAKVLNIALLL